MIHVVAPGPRSSLEGAPRYGRAHEGISAGGAADPRAAALANALVDNAADALVVEVTLAGPTLSFASAARIALAGAPFAAALDDVPLAWGAAGIALDVSPGQTLRIRQCTRGLRASLAVRGGLVGERGRVLAKGDALEVGAASRVSTRAPAWDFTEGDVVLRATPGPHDVDGALWTTSWRVSVDSDRRGIRLDGPALARPSEIITLGVTVGAVQVTSSGLPVILGVDRQTTGGYAQGAHVAAVDVWKLGQLRPGARLRFERVTHDEARARWRAQRALP